MNHSVNCSCGLKYLLPPSQAFSVQAIILDWKDSCLPVQSAPAVSVCLWASNLSRQREQAGGRAPRKQSMKPSAQLLKRAEDSERAAAQNTTRMAIQACHAPRLCTSLGHSRERCQLRIQAPETF